MGNVQCHCCRLLDVLEVVAPFKQFQKLRDFMMTKLPPGFPVRIGWYCLILCLCGKYSSQLICMGVWLCVCFWVSVCVSLCVYAYVRVCAYEYVFVCVRVCGQRKRPYGEKFKCSETLLRKKTLYLGIVLLLYEQKWKFKQNNIPRKANISRSFLQHLPTTVDLRHLQAFSSQFCGRPVIFLLYLYMCVFASVYICVCVCVCVCACACVHPCVCRDPSVPYHHRQGDLHLLRMAERPRTRPLLHPPWLPGRCGPLPWFMTLHADQLCPHHQQYSPRPTLPPSPPWSSS